MVRGPYEVWTGERVTPDGRFRVVKQKHYRGGQAVEYAVFDALKPNEHMVYGGSVTIVKTAAGDIDQERSTVEGRLVVRPNTTVARLFSARRWIEEAIASTSAVDRLAWLTRNMNDAPADSDHHGSCPVSPREIGEG